MDYTLLRQILISVGLWNLLSSLCVKSLAVGCLILIFPSWKIVLFCLCSFSLYLLTLHFENFSVLPLESEYNVSLSCVSQFFRNFSMPSTMSLLLHHLSPESDNDIRHSVLGTSELSDEIFCEFTDSPICCERSSWRYLHFCDVDILISFGNVAPRLDMRRILSQNVLHFFLLD